MSMSEASHGHGSPHPTHLTAYPSRADSGEASKHSGPPRLPPMSSLFRHDPMQERYQSTTPPLARQFQPPYNMAKEHPLTMSERDLAAPVYHIYHPSSQARPNSLFGQKFAETMLVPSTENHVLTYPPRRLSPPQVQRQFKKIVQRGQSDPKRRQSPTSLLSGQDGGATRRSPTVEFETSHSSRGPSNMSEPERRMSSQCWVSPSQTSNSYSSQGPASRSVPISGLLSDEPRYALPPEVGTQPDLFSPTIKSLQPKYSIRMRQEPAAARACGFGERDRRVIDPPPILQMDVDAPNASVEDMKALLRHPYSVVHCTLWDPVNDRDDTAMPGTTDKRQQRRLMGTLVASAFVGKDEHDVEGCFFCFPDLSVRTPGTYSLRFSLVTLDPSRMGPGCSSPVLSTVKSAVFNVYNAKDFGGMRASTELTKRLKHQGCLISVKKGNAKSNGKNGRDEDDDDEDDDEDDVDEGPKRKVAKRARR